MMQVYLFFDSSRYSRRCLRENCNQDTMKQLGLLKNLSKKYNEPLLKSILGMPKMNSKDAKAKDGVKTFKTK